MCHDINDLHKLWSMCVYVFLVEMHQPNAQWAESDGFLLFCPDQRAWTVSLILSRPT